MKTDTLTQRNFLKRASLAGMIGASGIGITGCSSQSYKYKFDRDIDGERVIFNPSNFMTYNVLQVKKSDGRTIEYFVRSNNSDIVDRLNIITNSWTKTYMDDEIGKPVIAEAKKQYNNYLRRILEEKDRIRQDTLKAKQKEGLGLLRK